MLNISNIKLGKLVKVEDDRTIRLGALLKPEALLIPETYDFDLVYPGLPEPPMFGNDMYGDCVIVGRAHRTLCMELLEQKKAIKIETSEVVHQYMKETGGIDSGLVLLYSLRDWRKNGWNVGGNIYKITAYGCINPLNHDHVRACIAYLGGIYVGAELPRSAQAELGKVWNYHSGRDGKAGSWGGHCMDDKKYIPLTGFNTIGPVFTTWGTFQQATWDFWDAYVFESYGIVDARNSNTSKYIDVDKLTQLLKQIEG